MPTWPNSTKASTTNLDAGTDRPSLARADLKQNVDNVNDIIDMLYIPSTPSNNQILKYNSTNSRFELASDSSGMTSFTVAGDSGTSQTINDGNTLTISGGTGLTAVASATDTITINLDNTAVTPNSYAIATITVDQQGRITAASAASTTGSGNVVLATSPSLTTPTLGVASATSINKVAFTAPASSATLTIADGKTLTVNNTVTLSGTDSTTLTLPPITSKLGYINLPAVGTKTTSYTLATGDVGKYVQVGSGGSITIPDATFAEGDVILVANNHTAAITITCTITTAYIAGTDSDKASVSLATRGVASIVFLSSTVCIISGNVT